MDSTFNPRCYQSIYQTRKKENNKMRCQGCTDECELLGIETTDEDSCDHCEDCEMAAEEDERDKPDAEDGFITERSRSSLYAVLFAGKYIGDYNLDDAAEKLRELTERKQYCPNFWFINERGNTEQFILTDKGVEYTGNGYV